jgi:hypothetical protein
VIVAVIIVITNQDSTSSRLLPGSSYSCCIRNLHALVHKQCHPVHITTAHKILQRRKWQLCKSTLPPNHNGSCENCCSTLSRNFPTSTTQCNKILYITIFDTLRGKDCRKYCPKPASDSPLDVSLLLLVRCTGASWCATLIVTPGDVAPLNVCFRCPVVGALLNGVPSKAATASI